MFFNDITIFKTKHRSQLNQKATSGDVRWRP